VTFLLNIPPDNRELPVIAISCMTGKTVEKKDGSCEI
jgi:hypothetical protein